MHRLAASASVLALLWTVGCSDDDKPVPDSAVADSTVDSQRPDAGDGAVSDAAPDGPAGATHKLIILHTNDMHAQLEGIPNADYTPATTGDDATLGGFARLAAQIKSERSAAGSTPVLLLDAGDFMMGSLFGWLDTTKAPEMSLLQDMGYDAVTLGNHELEWTSNALAAFIGAGAANGFTVPLVQSNMVFDATDPADDALEALTKDGTIGKKLVKTLPDGLKVGLFGIMGKDAADLSAPGLPVTFEERIAAAKKMITELRDQDKVDLVICLSHSGIEETASGEDGELAAKAPGIDVIISGHSHTKLDKPITVGDTLIVQTGKSGANLGKLELEVVGGKIAKSTYALIPIDDTIQGDSATQQKIDGYKQEINALLQPAGLAYNNVIAETTFDLTFPDFQETLVGNLVTDSYLNIYNTLNPSAPADAAIEAGGVIRYPLLKGKTGKLWLADVYRVMPNSVGPDQKPGTPLVAMYLNGKDLKAVGELTALAQGMLSSQVYFLQFAGMQLEYAKAGFPTMAVSSIKIGNPLQPVDFTDTTKCYKLLTNLYVAEMMSLASAASGGMLKFEAKESDCQTIITDPATHLVDADPATAGTQELKAWQALVQYVSSFPDTNSDSIPDIPSAYSQLQNRIIAK